MEDQIKDRITLSTVDQYNKLLGLVTHHPLVTIVDFSKATKTINDIIIEYELYAIFLKETKACNIKYGRREYDYNDGTIVSFSPGQIIEVTQNPTDSNPKGYGLLFHPDLIRRTSLGLKIGKYGFFSYSSFEALHISELEKKIIIECFEKITLELEHIIDNHSKQLITNNIELLLNYCLRFYDRQFITREECNYDILQKLEYCISEYWDSSLPAEYGLPTVKYFADKVFLSTNYFGDLIKKLTGKSAQEYIISKTIERAKDRITNTNLTMSEIAYELGFQYPQHFGRIFKKRTGITPNEYRKNS